MVKIKAIDQQYTMPEITAIVDELYPFGEYDLQEHKGTRKEVWTKEGKVIVHNGKVGVQVGGEFKEIKDGKFHTRDTKEEVTYHTIETNEAYCDKEDLMSLFFTLNKCNRKLAFSALPLTAREKRQLIEERAEAYKHLQAIINPVKPQLPTIKNTEKEQRAFERAIKAGYMERTDTGYKWLKDKVQLAVFANFLYEKIPFRAIERLFGVRGRLYSSLDGWRRAKKEPKWQKGIEDLTREA